MTKTLQSAVVDLLRNELEYHCEISCSLSDIILEINNADFEKHMGSLVKKIQLIIDLNYPGRDKDLCIIVRNKDRRTENLIKIWKPLLEF